MKKLVTGLVLGASLLSACNNEKKDPSHDFLYTDMLLKEKEVYVARAEEESKEFLAEYMHVRDSIFKAVNAKEIEILNSQNELLQKMKNDLDLCYSNKSELECEKMKDSIISVFRKKQISDSLEYADFSNKMKDLYFLAKKEYFEKVSGLDSSKKADSLQKEIESLLISAEE